MLSLIIACFLTPTQCKCVYQPEYYYCNGICIFLSMQLKYLRWLLIEFVSREAAWGLHYYSNAEIEHGPFWRVYGEGK